jgi:ABC-2 type transport system permease protein
MTGSSLVDTERRRSPLVAGTWALVRLDLRIDRVRLPLWVAGVVGLVVVSAASVEGLYPDQASVDAYVALVDLSPNMGVVNRAFNGPGFGFDRPNTGVVLVNEVALWGSIGFALMAVFQMSRHTRGEEDAGRTDLLRSRMVGRFAPLAAAAIGVAALELLVGVVVFAALVALGFGAVGSAALCAGYVGAGLVLGASTALAAQLVSTARAATGLGVAATGLAFVVRAVGDVGSGTLSWASPIGWVHRLRPFAGERWWVLALFVGACVVISTATVLLFERRDLGAGLFAVRLGPEHASRWSLRPTGLILRLQRDSLVGWSFGLFVLGLVYGLVGRDVEQMFADNPDMERFIALDGPSVIDSYLGYTLALGAMLAGGFAISSILRLRAEESAGRLELVLSRPTGRVATLCRHTAVALCGTGVVLVASGLGTGIGLAVALSDAGQVLRMVAASVALIPAVAVLVGVGALLIGWAPRWAPLSWGALAVTVVVGLFAELLSLPGALRWLSPLEHAPRLPAEPFELRSELALATVSTVMLGLAALGLSRRDIPAI